MIKQKGYPMVDPISPTSGSSSSPTPSKMPPVTFNPDGSVQFLGMPFTAEEWKKFMDNTARSLGEFINKRMQKALERMKEDWKRARNED